MYICICLHVLPLVQFGRSLLVSFEPQQLQLFLLRLVVLGFGSQMIRRKEQRRAERAASDQLALNHHAWQTRSSCLDEGGWKLRTGTSAGTMWSSVASGRAKAVNINGDLNLNMVKGVAGSELPAAAKD